jgi:hypothetical protein
MEPKEGKGEVKKLVDDLINKILQSIIHNVLEN